MQIDGQTMLAILAFFVVIGPLILFHEFGHFVAARLNHIVVEEFGIGLPPRVVTLFEKWGTKFTLNALPLGGFVRPTGEDDPTVPGGLAGASKTSRVTVLVAGPAANVLVTFILLLVMFLTGAPEELPGVRISGVNEGSPAAQSGLMVGDVVTDLDSVHVKSIADMKAYIDAHKGSAVLFKVMRGYTSMSLSITPRKDYPADQGATGIVIEPVTRVVQYPFFEALDLTVSEIFGIIQSFIELPFRLVGQQIPAKDLPLYRPVSVIGISQLGGQAIGNSIALNSAWPVLRLTAYISLALAITNLLPLPALDGGRILFVLVEFLRGRRVDPRRETVVHFVGFALLLTAMLVFVYLDIVNPLVRP